MEQMKVTKEDKRQLFVRMWEIAYLLLAKFGKGNVRQYLSPALKMAWEELYERKGIEPQEHKKKEVKRVCAGHYIVVKNFHKWQIKRNAANVWQIVHRGVTQNETYKTLKAAVESLAA